METTAVQPSSSKNGRDASGDLNDSCEGLGVSEGASKAEIADAFRKLTPPGPAARPLGEEDSTPRPYFGRSAAQTKPIEAEGASTTH